MAVPVILCIGTSSVAGDCLGPLVGDLLRDRYNVPAYVYGGLSSPVNGVNFTSYVRHIREAHKKSVVIAIDACVGEKSEIGKIKYTTKGVSAGGALDKRLGKVGDIGILGVVAERQKDNLSALMSASYGLVEEIARGIAERVNGMIKNEKEKVERQ
jgi:putative sporulation protein YyaC